MKSLILLFAMTIATGVFALPSYVQFSSVGPDKYTDGTVVQDGEIYALVWVKKDATFAGFTTRGEVVDKVNSKLVAAAPLAKDGHCKNAIFMLDGENADLGEGTFEIFLFDTRLANETGVLSAPTGVLPGLKFKAVNTYASAGKPAVTVGTEAESKVVESGSGIVAALPANVPNPKVLAIQVVGGKVNLTVGDTLPCLRYTVSSGDAPGKLAKNPIVKGINGSESGEITFVLENPGEDRFFRIIRDK